MYQGIDYGYGVSNIDLKTGIRYGVISQHSLSGDAANEIWTEGAVYDPFCPNCGDPLPEGVDDGHECSACHETIDDTADCYGDEPSYIEYHETTPDGDIVIQGCLDSDYIVVKSPYVTRGVFCSPCVPGAIDLDNPTTDGEFAYCLPDDFFEDCKAPYMFTLRGE